MPKLISIIIPCRPGRPDLIASCLQSLVDKTADKSRLEVLVKVDRGDHDTLAAVEGFHDQLPVRAILMDGLRGKEDLAVYTNELAKQAVGEFVWWWSDEIVMLTDGWDLVIAERESDADGFDVLLADIEKGTYGCYPMVTKKWLDTTGRWTWFSAIDWWIWAVCQRIPDISKTFIEKKIRIKDTTISGETVVDPSPSFPVYFAGDDLEREIQKDADKIKEAWLNVKQR